MDPASSSGNAESSTNIVSTEIGTVTTSVTLDERSETARDTATPRRRGSHRRFADAARAPRPQGNPGCYSVLMIAASPWPPPPQSAAAPTPPPRRRSSLISVSTTRVPDMPIG